MTTATTKWRQVVRLLRSPDGFLHTHLQPDRSLLRETFVWFAPAMGVRPLAVLVRSLILDAPATAVVLTISSLVLQVGVWLSVGLVLPVVAHQFQTTMREREGLLLAGFASLPLWFAGALFLVPETAPVPVFWWSRLLVFILALYGVYIVFRALVVLSVRREVRVPLVTAMGVTYVALYFVLFVLLGISSHIMLFIFGSSS
jgi:hypothetical protein